VRAPTGKNKGIKINKVILAFSHITLLIFTKAKIVFRVFYILVFQKGDFKKWQYFTCKPES